MAGLTAIKDVTTYC